METLQVRAATRGGMPIGEQGDCTILVCDGAGGVRLQADVSDIQDDGELCTLDACDGDNVEAQVVRRAHAYAMQFGSENECVGNTAA